MNNQILYYIKNLPKEIIDIIYEFNVDHRTYMKNIIDEIKSRHNCIYCNQRINNIIHISPSSRHLCNNICYRKLRRRIYGMNYFI